MAQNNYGISDWLKYEGARLFDQRDLIGQLSSPIWSAMWSVHHYKRPGQKIGQEPHHITNYQYQHNSWILKIWLTSHLRSGNKISKVFYMCDQNADNREDWYRKYNMFMVWLIQEEWGFNLLQIDLMRFQFSEIKSDGVCEDECQIWTTCCVPHSWGNFKAVSWQRSLKQFQLKKIYFHLTCFSKGVCSLPSSCKYISGDGGRVCHCHLQLYRWRLDLWMQRYNVGSARREHCWKLHQR